MTGAGAALVALMLAIVLSITSRLNIGVIAIALAWLVGVYFQGLKPDVVIQGFPSGLFLTLAGVSLLFGLAESNGTLERLTGRALAAARGQVRWLPLFFFVLAGTVSSIGPGAISAVALLAPVAMAVAARAGIPVFLMALMVANGANAGNLSPISSVGVIANAKMAEAGLVGHAGMVWFANLAAHILVGLAAYFGLGGHRLTHAQADADAPGIAHVLQRRHWITIGVVIAWIVGIVVFKLPLGLAAFGGAGVILAVRAGEEGPAIRAMPWGVILMVSGMSVLVAILEKTGGMELFTGLLARLATPWSLNGMIAFVTGAISTYSSTSGVVLPAFLPTAAGLVAKVGGGNPLAVALSINVGSALVDVSPLSTLGALCLATVTEPRAASRLFRQLMIWGLSMTVVGALLCQLFAGMLAGLSS